MSPEYLMHGLFSTKSDVFSFGVIVLEIVSGRKNANFYESDHSLNLLGHVSGNLPWLWPKILVSYTAVLYYLGLKCENCCRLGIYGNLGEQRSWRIQHWLIQVQWKALYPAFRWVCYVSKTVQRIGQPCRMLFQCWAMKGQLYLPLSSLRIRI